jgi:hypothetical protein
MVISEEHEVIAFPACGGHDKTVTFEKPDGCTDFLAFRIIQRRKLIHIHTELCQITPFQPQRPIGADLDAMHDNGFEGNGVNWPQWKLISASAPSLFRLV